MKLYIQLLIISFTALVPTALVAQDSTVNSSSNFQFPTVPFKSKMEIKVSPDATNTSTLSLKSDSAIAFRNHLPMAGRKLQNKVINAEPVPFHSNMPIAKPEKTSKILIVKLDDTFPYHYKMPVMKVKSKQE